MFDQKKDIKAKVKVLEESIRKASEMIMKTDLVNMKRVMRRLDLCEKNDVPTLKGKVSCQISAADELLATELLFSGIFSNLDSNQTAALCSCLIYTDGKNENKLVKDPKLSDPFFQLTLIADKVATIMIDSKIPLDKEEYVKKFKPDMMEITYKWC